MSAVPRVLAVIPVYNHGATLAQVAEGILAVHADLLVVDDGSTDGGADRLSGLPLAILRQPRNLGKGTAIMAAAKWAKAHGFTHLATLDADGQHDPADLPRLLEAVAVDPRAIVVGRRDFDGSVPGSSRFGRSFSNFWFRVQTGSRIGDTQSGYRAYPVAVLERLGLGERRYSFEVEVLVKAAWADVPLREVPVSVAYPPGRVSHFHRLFDNLRLSLLNTRLTTRAILPWPHRRLDETAGEGISPLHPVRAIRVLLAEHATPGKLAAAGFTGVFLGTLPLVGIHTMAVLVAAGLLRLNRTAAVAASQLCMPPLVPALCIEAGYFLRHGRLLTEISWQTLGREGLQRLGEWILGSLLLAPLLGAIVALFIYAVAHGTRASTGGHD